MNLTEYCTPKFSQVHKWVTDFLCGQKAGVEAKSLTRAISSDATSEDDIL